MEKSKNLKSEYKRCTKCGRELPLHMFGKDKKGKNGLKSSCRECRSNLQKEHYRNNKEHYAEYRLANADKLAQYRQANKHYDLYVAYDEYGNVQYVGTTRQGINGRISTHKSRNTFTGRVAKGTELGKILFIRLDEYNLNTNELRYIEQRFINELEPVENKNNAITTLDYIEADRLATLMVLSDDLLDSFEDNALVYVDRNITNGLDEWLEGKILA